MKNTYVYLLVVFLSFTGCEETSLDPFEAPPESYEISVMSFLQNPSQVLFFNEVLANDDYAMFIQALQRTGLDVSAVNGKNNTIFAPGSVAMQRILDSDDSWNTIDDIPVDTLSDVLKLHILPGRQLRSGFTENPEEYNTLLDGSTITIFATPVGENGRGRNIRVEAATVQSGDLQFTDGVVHTYGIAGTRPNNNESKPIGF